MDGEGSLLVLPILFKLRCRRMFIQQAGMESGIDIKFPSFALAVAKLRMGRGIIIEEIPMMSMPPGANAIEIQQEKNILF